MKLRQVKKTVRGQRAIDGAGVQLVRVLGHSDVYDFDPFLMMDGFDSTNPEDYMKGFPFHPHRGIETFTYLIHGHMNHRDSLGNEGSIRDGEGQWMTAASGIMHEEMPVARDRILGFQLWINMSKEEKMTAPSYHDLTEEKFAFVKEDHASIKVLSGEYKGQKGFFPPHVQATIYDITLDPNQTLTIDVKPEDRAYVYLIDGDAIINGESYDKKTAVLFEDDGDSIQLTAPDAGTHFIVFMGKPLNQPIAWAGPVVMNTKEELQETFRELENGTFIKHRAEK